MTQTGNIPLGLQIEIAIAIVFVSILAIYLYKRRAHITLQKIMFPLLYMIMLRRSWGIKLMDHIGTKHRETVKLFGYIGIGVGFVGMIGMAGLFIFLIREIIRDPSTPAVAPVLPFTSIPGIGFLGFTHWLIALVFLIVVHEFAHGIVARAHNIEIRSSGLAVLGVLVPIFPAAFVEPDDKKMSKASDVVRYSILAAGPFMNIIWFLIFVLILAFAINPAQQAMVEPVGFSFNVIEGMPAQQAGLTNGTLINQFQGEPALTTSVWINEVFYGVRPGEQITFGFIDQQTGQQDEFIITTTNHPDDPKRSFIGITSITDQFRYKEPYEQWAPAFEWIQGLVLWLALLNFAVGTINLLPMIITDGGQMFTLAMTRILGNPNRAALWSLIVGKVLWGVIIIGLLLWLYGLF